MFLQKLSEYADRLDMPPPMYQWNRVRWFIDLDADGSLLGFIPLDDGARKNNPGRDMLAPHALRAFGIRPKLLADTGEYVLGIPREKSSPERVSECHRQFKDLTKLCAEETGEPGVAAVEAFLKRWDPQEPGLPPAFDPGNVLTFRVADAVVIDSPAVRRFWATRQLAEPENETRPRLQCVVCGEVKPVEIRLPFKVKGIPGGQTSGTSLISANAAAFESYGLEKSLIAPTCLDCAERFSNAVNALLASEHSSIRVGPLVYVFWTRESCEFDIGTLLSQPDAGRVKTLIESAWKGREASAVEPMEFYATSLSASGGRAVVRDWLETTVGDVKRNVARWFALQRLVDADGEEGAPVGIYALAASLYRDANKELVANVPRALLRTALHGAPLPDWLLYQVVRRNRAGQGTTRPRTVLTKMLLTQQEFSLDKETIMEKLDRSNRTPAYLCGRLLAELEQAQRLAVNPKATLVDRYFGAASSAPATVFGPLLRGAQAHLSKLRKTREGAYHGIQQRLEEILEGLLEFPKTLTLKDQALFGLGYYHQRAADRAAARAKRELNDEEAANQ